MSESIESQFWKLQTVDVTPLKLNIEIVDVLPEKIFKKAKTLLCWAFKYNEKNRPLLCGFPIDDCGHITQIISKVYATVNENGVIQDLGGHNAIRSFRLPIRYSAIRLFYLIEILRQNGDTYYNVNEIQNIIDDMIDNKGADIK